MSKIPSRLSEEVTAVQTDMANEVLSLDEATFAMLTTLTQVLIANLDEQRQQTKHLETIAAVVRQRMS